MTTPNSTFGKWKILMKNCQIRKLEHHKTLKMVGTHVQVNCFSEGRGGDSCLLKVDSVNCMLIGV